MEQPNMGQGQMAAPQPTPAPVAAPPQPMPAAPQPMSGGGGTDNYEKGGSIKDFFSDVNIVDIAISAFIVAGVLYSIHYFKFMMTLEKSGYSDLSSKVAKLESAVKAQQAEMNATGSGYKRSRPIMRIG